MNLGPKAKMWMAVIGTAIMDIITIAGTVMDDSTITVEEGGTLVTALIINGFTIYGVWKVENKKTKKS